MKSTSTPDIRTIADGLGVLGAAACALHCIALPALLVLGTTLPTVFFADESFHRSMLWWVVPAAVIAFALGCKRHRDRRVLLLGVLGVAGLLLSGTVLHDLMGETAEKLATLGSAILLVCAHLRNYRLCRSDACRHDDA
ncbi:MAG: MerC domain-containing protein [Acidobacteriota bacterium]